MVILCFSINQLLSFSLQDFKRDIQARLLQVETYGGETFLSEELAINILQETKNAFSRCQCVCFAFFFFL